MAEITRFMDDAWKHTYQGRERFIYDEPYLRWAFGWQGFDSDLSLLAYKGEKLVGGGYTKDHILRPEGNRHGDRVRPERAALGKGQRAGQEHLCERYEKSNFGDARHFFLVPQVAEPSPLQLQIQTRADPDLRDYGDYAFKARVFDADRLVSNSDLLFHEKAFIRLLARPPRRQKAAVEIIDAGNLEECLDFANNRAKQHDGRIFAPDEFARYAAFEHGEFQSLGLIIRIGGRIRTLAVGYPIYTEFKRRDRVFFLDYYITAGGNDLPSLEGIIRDRFDVHTILSLYPSHGLRNLYLPTRNVLALKAVEFRESLRPCKPMIVDHK